MFSPAFHSLCFMLFVLRSPYFVVLPTFFVLIDQKLRFDHADFSLAPKNLFILWNMSGRYRLHKKFRFPFHAQTP